MIHQSPIMVLILLLGAHAFFDFAGQGEFMSRAKNKTVVMRDIPWWYVMSQHCVIHGSAVAVITGVWWLFFAEFSIHFLTDHVKCKNGISFITDQCIHIVCKLIWWIIGIYLVNG